MNLGRLGNCTTGASAPAAVIMMLILFGGGSLAISPRTPVPVQAQSENYQPDSLFIALLSGGDALVEYDIKISDPQKDVGVTLFGNQDFRDLIVADFNDNLIAYDPGAAKNQILLRAPSATDVRISYSTQDLLNKTGKTWSFSLNSPVTFTVKLPANSVLTDTAGSNPPAIKTLGGQYLLTFDPGPSNLTYIIGVVGTENQASIVVKAADTTIREIKNEYPDIILTQAEAMLRNATTFLTDGRFADAESLAGKANDAAVSASRDYADAQSAISVAEQQIANATSQGRDASTAISMLQSAKNDFAKGDYADAKDLAEESTGAIGAASGGSGGNSQNPSGSGFPLLAVIVGTVAAAGGGGGLLFLRMRSRSGAQLSRVLNQGTPKLRASDAGVKESSAIDPIDQANPVEHLSTESALSRPSVPEASDLSDKTITPRTINPAASAAAPSFDSPSSIADSQTNPGVLSRIVGRIFEEKPSLRQEDRDVLSFLAEKEGAAFESEIRNKFQLPKTTIWRLVKRLEREELIEIRKAGGQNLIKLKFEGRNP